MKAKTTITAAAATALPAISKPLGVAAGVAVCASTPATVHKRVNAPVRATANFFISTKIVVWVVLILRLLVQLLYTEVKAELCAAIR